MRVVHLEADYWGHGKLDGTQPRHLVHTELNESLSSAELSVERVEVPPAETHRLIRRREGKRVSRILQRIADRMRLAKRDLGVFVSIWRSTRGADVLLTTQGLGIRASLLKRLWLPVPRIVAICYDPFPVLDGGRSELSYKQRLEVKLRKAVYSGFAAMVLVSEEQESLIRPYLPEALAVHFLPMAIDNRTFFPVPRKRANFVFMVDGALRDYELVRDAICSGKSSVNHLVIAHRHQLSSSRLRALKQIETCGIQVTLRPNATAAELRQLYSECAAVIVPVRKSLQPAGLTALLEAMATGSPVVCPNSFWVRDYAVPGRDVLTYEEGDSSTLAASIRQIVHDPGLANAIGRSAQEVSLKYSFANSRKSMRKILLSVYSDGQENAEATPSPLS